MMFLLPIGILLIVAAAVGLTTRPGGQDGSAPARQLLDARLARGEITRDEYQQRAKVLTEGRSRHAGRGPAWALGGAGLVLVLLAVPLAGQAGPGDGWWDWHGSSMAAHTGWNQPAAAPTTPPASGAPEQIVAAGEMWFAPERIEIEAGTYEFTCTVPGHAAAGMRGELVVTGAG